MNHDTGGSHIAYSGRATNWGYLPYGILVAGFYVVLQGRYDVLSIIGPVLFITLPLQMLTSMRTIAGPGGVVARYGFGVWRLRYPAATIERADVVDLPADRAVIRFWRQEFWRRHTIDSGPYLRLHLANGRRVLLTAPDPYAAAAVVNHYALNSPRDVGGLDAGMAASAAVVERQRAVEFLTADTRLASESQGFRANGLTQTQVFLRSEPVAWVTFAATWLAGAFLIGWTTNHRSAGAALDHAVWTCLIALAVLGVLRLWRRRFPSR